MKRGFKVFLVFAIFCLGMVFSVKADAPIGGGVLTALGMIFIWEALDKNSNSR